MRDYCRQADSALQSAGNEPGTFFARLLKTVLGKQGMAGLVDAYYKDAYCSKNGPYHGSPLMSAAGYLFDPGQAETFEKEWRGTLWNAGIQGFFRMYELAHQTGEFEGWTRVQCDQFSNELVYIIKTHMLWGVVVAAATRDVQDYVSAHLLLKGAMSSLYTFCVVSCVAMIGQWAVQHCSAETTVFYFIEVGMRVKEKFSGYESRGEVLNCLNRVGRSPALTQQYRYRGSSFLKKDYARPLEAANLLAWEWYNFYEGSYVTGRPRRDSLRSLLEKPHGTLFFHGENVEDQVLHLIYSGFVEEENP
jgi:hypothetical protein